MIHNSKIVILLTVIVSLVVPLSAQTAEKVEGLLNTNALTWSEAAFFALEVSEQAMLENPDEAFRYALDRKWFPQNISANDYARLNGISLLLMKAFELKGGIFFSVFNNSHYAYRELVYKDIIQGKRDPEITVSGEEFLFMISRILSMKESASPNSEPESTLPAPIESEENQDEREELAEEINTQLETQHVSDAKVSVTSEGVTISLTNVQFLANSAELSDFEKEKIQQLSGILGMVPERNLLITGHTAQAGIPEERLRTSIERAQSVADYIVQLGLRKAEQITVRGYGSERPIADNSTEEGLAQNRRVEITILRTTEGR
ncbi:MAG: OmpA family protein [Treponema sp.]|jgi:outer membrane protein OmpA-like peptidoglycan-associated protein|nr:OmpA family protein [Treponema sp.]